MHTSASVGVGNRWVVRAVILCGVVVSLRVILGLVLARWPHLGTTLRLLAFVLLAAAILMWGFFDGRRDRNAHADPADGADLTLIWLLAAAAAALGSALLSWLAGLIPGLDTGGNSLLFELIAGAAFVTLTILAAAQLGLALGRLATTVSG